jgi:hypothetical protein
MQLVRVIAQLMLVRLNSLRTILDTFVIKMYRVCR